MRKWLLIGDKKPEFYGDIAVLADLGLHSQVAEAVRGLCPPARGRLVLDFGAGQGALSQRLVDLGYTVVAVDKNKEDFRCRGAKFYKFDFDKATEIKAFRQSHKNRFDVVLGVEVIEHVENPWEYVRILVSLLKPGGFLVLTTPNVTSWLSRLIFLFTGKFHQFQERDLDYGHTSPITAWELRLVLRSAGLEQIEISPAGTLPVFWLQKSMRFLALNLLGILLRPFMRGLKDGWCLIVIGQKR